MQEMAVPNSPSEHQLDPTRDLLAGLLEGSLALDAAARMRNRVQPHLRNPRLAGLATPERARLGALLVVAPRAFGFDDRR